jgi:carboxyl-terminal processing protease
MFARCFLAVLACFFATAASAATDYRALFDKVWSSVNDNFYDPDFHGVDWKAVGDRYRAKLVTVKTDRDFDVLASAMLKEIGTSHIYIVPPRSSPASDVGIGVVFRDLGNQTVVSVVAPLSDADVRAGDRLLSPRAALRGPAGSVANARFETCGGKQRNIAAHRVGAFWPPAHPGFTWSVTRIGEGKTIGYLRIDRFDDGAAALADQAMAALKDTNGLIIDIRANTGGNASALRLQIFRVRCGAGVCLVRASLSCRACTTRDEG